MTWKEFNLIRRKHKRKEKHLLLHACFSLCGNIFCVIQYNSISTRDAFRFPPPPFFCFLRPLFCMTAAAFTWRLSKKKQGLLLHVKIAKNHNWLNSSSYSLPLYDKKRVTNQKRRTVHQIWLFHDQIRFMTKHSFSKSNTHTLYSVHTPPVLKSLLRECEHFWK